MNRINKLLLGWIFCMFIGSTQAIENPSQYVNPNIGSAHSRWFFYTPGAMPFGMAKPAPTTNGHYGNKYGWDACGYDPRHTSIEGFVNFHEFQIGGIALMPTRGALKTLPGDLDKPDSGFRSRYSHKNETAQPGYYSVLLDDYGIKAELTATPRVAIHRYTYPKDTHSRILFNIGYREGESGAVTDAFVTKVTDHRIEGFVQTLPEYVKAYQPGSYIKMYFVAEINKEAATFGSYKLDKVFPQKEVAHGYGCGLYWEFATEKDEAVEVKVALSYTSIENAAKNLEKEALNKNFDQVKEESHQTWNQMLGRIDASGGTNENFVKFYTGLYHALLGRGLASDVNGDYIKNNGDIGHIPCNKKGVPEYNYYNTDAVWGAFWNLTQLWAIAYPEYYNDFVQCQLSVYKDCGWLADGLACSRFVSGVGTNYQGLVIASAYNRGIRNYSDSLAWEAVKNNELGWKNRVNGAGKADIEAFLELGYSPFEKTNAYYSGSSATGSQFSASHTLEYSYSAYAAAVFAEQLGKTQEATKLEKLSHGWELLYDASTGYIRPKLRDGSFITPFDPKDVWKGFQEGNAFQYTFYVPHNPKGLIKKVGENLFTQRLDTLFMQAEKTNFGGGTKIDAFSGLESVYNHGNQPSLHISWMFNFSGAPWLTQKWVRRICDQFYGADPIHGYGYGQDEDQGQLGAWYVLAAMGLFDVSGGVQATPTLQLSSPLFKKISIHLSSEYYSGKTFTIVAPQASTSKGYYIKKATWNGNAYNSNQILWSDFIEGGTLEYKLSDKPNKNWGTTPLNETQK